MLHSAILPHHTKWVSLFENLKYVVIDELHIYRGVFGSHVANVIQETTENLSVIMEVIRYLSVLRLPLQTRLN